jgi:hypothetical protein
MTAFSMPQLTVSRPPAAQGLAWVKQGWDLFKLAPVPWAGMTALVFLLLMGVVAVPYVGKEVVHILSPFVVVGFLAASRAGRQGETINFLYLGSGFNQGRNSLFFIGLVYMLGTFLTLRVVPLLAGGDLAALMAQVENPRVLTEAEAEAILQGILPTLALATLLMVPLLMATWFSPALVYFEGFSPGKAIWWSLWACTVNWRPLLVYSSILGLLGIFALIIPYGLGLLVFIPWTLTSTYAAYEDIFAPVADDPGP